MENMNRRSEMVIFISPQQMDMTEPEAREGKYNAAKVEMCRSTADAFRSECLHSPRMIGHGAGSATWPHRQAKCNLQIESELCKRLRFRNRTAGAELSITCRFEWN